MGRARPWQVVRMSGNGETTTRSYYAEKEALQAAIEWVGSMAPHLDIKPKAYIWRKDVMALQERDVLTPQNYLVALNFQRETMVHTYPAQTLDEADRGAAEAIGRAIAGEKPDDWIWVYPQELPVDLRA